MTEGLGSMALFEYFKIVTQAVADKLGSILIEKVAQVAKRKRTSSEDEFKELKSREILETLDYLCVHVARTGQIFEPYVNTLIEIASRLERPKRAELRRSEYLTCALRLASIAVTKCELAFLKQISVQKDGEERKVGYLEFEEACSRWQQQLHDRFKPFLELARESVYKRWVKRDDISRLRLAWATYVLALTKSRAGKWLVPKLIDEGLAPNLDELIRTATPATIPIATELVSFLKYLGENVDREEKLLRRKIDEFEKQEFKAAKHYFDVRFCTLEIYEYVEGGHEPRCVERLEDVRKWIEDIDKQIHAGKLSKEARAAMSWFYDYASVRSLWPVAEREVYNLAEMIYYHLALAYMKRCETKKEECNRTSECAEKACKYAFRTISLRDIIIDCGLEKDIKRALGAGNN